MVSVNFRSFIIYNHLQYDQSSAKRVTFKKLKSLFLPPNWSDISSCASFQLVWLFKNKHLIQIHNTASVNLLKVIRYRWIIINSIQSSTGINILVITRRLRNTSWIVYSIVLLYKKISHVKQSTCVKYYLLCLNRMLYSIDF